MFPWLAISNSGHNETYPSFSRSIITVNLWELSIILINPSQGFIVAVGCRVFPSFPDDINNNKIVIISVIAGGQKPGFYINLLLHYLDLGQKPGFSVAVS
ncbi:hypothetical protein PL8927_780254 [Planktothrix serta PCC 8927]|uniref:Uncharacterized protein n=1 Tax=Planktothrix serta PCC 8927 TaxID=671068 RepID=A0A7Z9BVU6_9CYAN|nr:hypothetical protein PL8927_780254 [Planktothrix serta PCC 8927]